MEQISAKAFLFDLDGVIFNTEGQYSEFWNGIGLEYFGDGELAARIKGQTLEQTFSQFFPDDEAARAEVKRRLYAFEDSMDYVYVPGALEFLEALKAAGHSSAIVTSSNRDKMDCVYRARPEILTAVGRILTGEDFTRSKPWPDCYLLGMKVCGTSPSETVVFEDSFHGLKAARASGAKVVALATTNAREAVAPYSSLVLDDFRGAAALFGL